MSSFDKVIESYVPYGDNPFGRIKDKIIVVFDTETTGLKPRESQITELAAKSFNGNDFEEIDTLHTHVRLNSETLQQIELQKSAEVKGMKVHDILSMTDYYNSSLKAIDERAAIEQLSNFIPKGAVMVAHNAKFDMKMVNTRAKMLGTEPIRHYSKVLDTMVMSREFFIPMSQELEMDGNLESKKLLDKLTQKWTSTGKRAKVSSRLGDLAPALLGQIDNWHQALADVQTTAALFRKFKEFFDEHFGSELKYNHDFIRRFNRAYQYRKR